MPKKLGFVTKISKNPAKAALPIGLWLGRSWHYRAQILSTGGKRVLSFGTPLCKRRGFSASACFTTNERVQPQASGGNDVIAALAFFESVNHPMGLDLGKFHGTLDIPCSMEEAAL